MKRILSSGWMLMTIILVVPLIAFATVHWFQNRYDRLPVLSEMNNTLYSDYHFINQYSQPRTFNSWKNKIIITDFFFTACPTICPKLTAGMKIIATAFANDNKVQLLSFTVDPKHDSAQKLLKYAQLRNDLMPNWEFITGTKKDIYKLARKQFFLVVSEGDGGPDDFIHSDRIVLSDTQNKIRGYYDGTNKKETEQLVDDIKKLENEN